MKKLTALIICLFLLCGCHSSDREIDGALDLRQKLSSANGCQFDCIISADYSDVLYNFSMNCIYDHNGNMRFTVINPESISGISGSIDQNGGKLTFDDKVLAFPILADGYISPVSAPWFFMNTLCGGYIRACGQEGERIRIIIDDTYHENSLQADIWTDQDYLPLFCEFLWQGRRILSIEINNYMYL